MISIRLAGPNAETLAADVEAFLREAGGEPTVRRESPPDKVADRADAATVAAVAAVVGAVLQIATAIKDSLELAERRQRAEQIDRLLKAIEAKASPADRVDLSVDGGAPVDLTTAGRDRVMDALAGKAARGD